MNAVPRKPLALSGSPLVADIAATAMTMVKEGAFAADIEGRLRKHYRGLDVTVASDQIEEGIKLAYAVSSGNFSGFGAPQTFLDRVGFSAMLRRRQIGMAAGIAVAAMVASAAGLYGMSVVEARNIERDRILFSQTLPKDLKDRAADALSKVNGFDDLRAKMDASINAASKAIEAANRDAYDAEIDRLAALGTDAVARVASDAMLQEAQGLIAETAQMKMDEPARLRMSGLGARVENAARSGSRDEFSSALYRFKTMRDIITTEAILTIVSAEGEQSGVWRMIGNDHATRRDYIVVEAKSADGSPVSIPLRDAETGSDVFASKFALHVPRTVYDRVGKDKQADGIVDERDVGFKPAGHLSVKWTVDTSGQTITRW